jgi:hypothetical protein
LGWVKIRIWDKHPGSATLAFGPPGSGFGSVIIGKDPNPAQTAQNFEKHVLKNQCCGSGVGSAENGKFRIRIRILVRGSDPRIWIQIRIKMSLIRNTVQKYLGITV